MFNTIRALFSAFKAGFQSTFKSEESAIPLRVDPPITYTHPPVSSIRGVVRAILDGDSLVADTDQGRLHVRLLGIDCPEAKQPFYQEAKTFTFQNLINREIELLVYSNSFNRAVAEIIVNGQNFNQRLVRNGLAWVSPYHTQSATYLSLQQEARQLRKGLWQDANPVAPWRARKHRATKN